MYSHLIPHFEDLLDTFLIDSEFDESVFRINKKTPHHLREEFENFVQIPGMEIYYEVLQFRSEAEYIKKLFLSSLMPDFSQSTGLFPGSIIHFESDSELNRVNPGLSSRDVELLVNSLSSSANKKRPTLVVSAVAGNYLKFKVGIGKNTERASLTSEKFYHFSRFTKAGHAPQHMERMQMEIFRMIEDGSIVLTNKFQTEKKPNKIFVAGEIVYHKIARDKYKLTSNVFNIKDDQLVSCVKVDDLGLATKAISAFNPDTLVSSPFIQDIDKTHIICGDSLKISSGVVDQVMEDMGWKKPNALPIPDTETKRDEIKAYFFMRSIIFKMEFLVVDFYIGRIYLKLINHPQYPNLLKNLAIDNLLIKSDPNLFELSPTSRDYLKRTGKSSGVSSVTGTVYTTYDYKAKQLEEEEMKRKKRREEEEERARLDKEDKEYGFVDLSRFEGKIVQINAPSTSSLVYLNDKIGIIDSVNSDMGRVTIEFEDKKIWFRASQGHMDFIKIISGLVVCSDETPELV